MRRQVVIAGAALGVAVLTILLLVALAPPASQPAPMDEDHRDRRISFEDHDSGVWPYLSSERTFRRTSPINVVVKGEPATVVDVLRGDAGDFQDLSEEEREPSAGEEVFGDSMRNGSTTEDVGGRWEATEGATRYAYVDDGSGGQWVEETAQLQDGTYYGHRYHVRAYASPAPEESWVAMQAHREHFDWFTLRHEVHGTESAQNRVEDVFFEHPRVDDLWRAHVGNDDSSDSDGWASMVVLAAGLVGIVGAVWPLRRRYRASGPARGQEVGDSQAGPIERVYQRWLTPVDRRRLAALRTRLGGRTLALPVAIGALLLGVRFAGIALELYADFLSMHAIAALLYPLVALGIPIATYGIARGIERRMDAAVAASGGLAVAVLADFAYIGVDSIPISTLLQRVAIIFALGLIAAGGARRATTNRRGNALAIVGGVLWVAFLGATLLGYL